MENNITETLLDKINKADEIKKQNEDINNKKEFPVMSLTEIFATKADPRELLLSPWLPKAGLAMVFAATGIGKTYFCLNCAYAIAGGGDFLSFAAPKARKVLYIDGEMKFIDIQERLRSISAIQGPLDNPSNFMLITPDKCPDYYVPKIDTPEGQKIINDLIDKHNIDLIVIDNISTLTKVDENPAEAWNIVQDWEIKVRASGRSILLVHHAGKDKNKQRGTSKREDILDTNVLLQEVKNEAGEMKFRVNFEKHRGFYGQDILPFEACLSAAGIWTTNTIEQSSYDKVLKLFKLGMNAHEIMVELKIDKSLVYKYIKKAKLENPLI